MTMTKFLVRIGWVVFAACAACVATVQTAYAEVLPGAEPAPGTQEAIARRRAEGLKQEAKARVTMAEVLASPDFSTEQTMRVPALKKRVADDSPDWMKYLERFGRFVARALRAGVWILGAMAVAVLLVTLHGWWRMAANRVRVHAVSLPTHVGELDIRAASLPEDVGAAARARWQVGDVTGSLSLLYRGALSALVLRHAAPIRSSYTEAECLPAAKARLPADAYAYVDALTRAWLQTVYAGRHLDDAAGLALCDGFAVHFPTGRVATVATVATAGRSASGAAA